MGRAFAQQFLISSSHACAEFLIGKPRRRKTLPNHLV